MWNYLIGPLLAFLPVRWRTRLAPEAPVNWPRAGLMSGLVELCGCLGGLIAWYLYAIQKYLNVQAEYWTNTTRDVPGGEHAIGFAALFIVATHPVTWALSYFTLEGALRTLAALLTDESPASLPLVLVERLVTRMQRRRELARVPLVADEVARGDGQQPWALRVASCRAKPTWRYPLAIQCEGEFYQVTGVLPPTATGARLAEQTASRPHVYLLQRAHPGEALRGLEHYDPADVLRPVSEPGFFGIVFGELRRRWHIRRAPLVRDEVRETLSRDAAGLEVRSCRPKPEWTHGRIVRFQDTYYRVESSRVDSASRPFVFTLRKLPAGVPGRNVMLYSPDEPFQKAG